MRASPGSAAASWPPSSRTNWGSGPIFGDRLTWSSMARRSRSASSEVAENLFGGRSANMASTKASTRWLVIGPPLVPVGQSSAGRSAV